MARSRYNPRSRSPGRRRWRRGLTFIETAAAAAVLGLVAAFVLGAFNTMIASQTRQQRRLGAAELCNRLILQYLDDREALPSPTLPIAYGGARYRWRLQEVPVRLSPARPDVAAERANVSSLSVDRIQLITVAVWLSEESGGSYEPDATVPNYTVSRLLDPVNTRNPDSFGNLLSNPQGKGFRDYMDRMKSFSKSTGSGTGTRATPARTPPAPSAPEKPK